MTGYWSQLKQTLKYGWFPLLTGCPPNHVNPNYICLSDLQNNGITLNGFLPCDLSVHPCLRTCLHRCHNVDQSRLGIKMSPPLSLQVSGTSFVLLKENVVSVVKWKIQICDPISFRINDTIKHFSIGMLHGSPYSQIAYLRILFVFVDSLPVLVVFAIQFLTVNHLSFT